MIQGKDKKIISYKDKRGIFLYNMSCSQLSEKKIENKLSGKLSNSSAFLLFEYSRSLSTDVKIIIQHENDMSRKKLMKE